MCPEELRRKVICNCTKGCGEKCSCRRLQLRCTEACKCSDVGISCGNEEEPEEEVNRADSSDEDECDDS